MNNKLAVIVKSGVIATAAMTMLIVVAPFMGMPEMYIGNMLADFMHIPVVLGWVMHFMIGTVFAAGFVFVFQSRLPGSAAVKGILFGLIPFVLAQIMVMPVMGAGLFSSNTPAPLMMVMGSLLGHIVYGATLGFTAKKS